MEEVDIRDVSLDWYVEWWNRHRDEVHGKSIHWKIHCDLEQNISLRFSIDKVDSGKEYATKDLIKITTKGNPAKFSSAFKYLSTHTILEFFKNWNDNKRGNR